MSQLATQTNVHPTIALLQRDRTKEELALVLPKGMDVEALVSRAKLALLSNPSLLECTPQSILLSVKKSVASGLELNGRDCHLVKYGNTCQFIIDYKGYIALAKRCGLVTVFAEIVRARDVFRIWTDDMGRHILHEFDVRQERGEVIGAYSMTKDKDGNIDVEYMTVVEINAVKARSKAKDSGPWKTDENEMRKKTVVRRHSKRWEISPDFMQAQESDDDAIDATAAAQVTGGRIVYPEEPITPAAVPEEAPAETDSQNEEGEHEW